MTKELDELKSKDGFEGKRVSLDTLIFGRESASCLSMLEWNFSFWNFSSCLIFLTVSDASTTSKRENRKRSEILNIIESTVLTPGVRTTGADEKTGGLDTKGGDYKLHSVACWDECRMKPHEPVF